MSAGWDLVLGASSGIGKVLARRLAAEGRRLVLSGRDGEELDRFACDLRLRGAAEVVAIPADVREVSSLDDYARQIDALDGPFDRAFLLTGLLGDMAQAKTDLGRMRELMEANLTGPIALLHPVAARMAAQKRGAIAVVSSVAGDRGRPSNYPYGAAKAGMSAWASGLRADLWRQGVHLCLVKPGFVDTAMTYGRPGMVWVASPERVAAGILDALERRRNVVYLPWFWRWILLAVCLVPEWLFKRLRT